jgi:diaminopimelate decarboxylase
VAILSLAEEQGLDVDVASEGELEAALRAGFTTDRIHVHGNNKSVAELERAVREGVRAVVIDCLSEIDRLQGVCARHGRVQRVMLRLAPGVDPVTHHAISTGQEDTKFGLNIADGSADEGARRIIAAPDLDLVGFHCHVGSQLMDSEAQVAGASRVSEFAVRYASECGPDVEIGVGGGLGIRYSAADIPEDVTTYCEEIADAALKPFRESGLPLPTLCHEPGRRLVGEAGTTLYTIGVIKSVPVGDGVQRTYVSVDGGLADNPRPQLYDAVYTAINASRAGEPHDTEYCVSGRHCETDTLIPSAFLPRSTAEGDILAVSCTGAYNQSMASNYNRYPRPALVIVGSGDPWVAVERETIGDLFRLEHVRAEAKRR